MDNEKEKISLENQGDHHYAKISVDKNTKEVSAGAIYSFSDKAFSPKSFSVFFKIA